MWLAKKPMSGVTSQNEGHIVTRLTSGWKLERIKQNQNVQKYLDIWGHYQDPENG